MSNSLNNKIDCLHDELRSIHRSIDRLTLQLCDMKEDNINECKLEEITVELASKLIGELENESKKEVKVKLTDEQLEINKKKSYELYKILLPVMEFIEENYNSNCCVKVTSESVDISYN